MVNPPWRRQLPVHSPVPPRALAAGLSAVLRGPDPRPELQALLQRELGARTVQLCGSGTEALQLALRAGMASRKNDIVALPAFACFDLLSAAVGARARIAAYDVEPATLGPDLTSLERALRAGAGTVVAAPLYGIPLEWESIASLCAAHGALLIEDAAQGAGASWRGQPLGSLGDISVLSFGRGKGWTGGGGGALLAREDITCDALKPLASNAGTLVRGLAHMVLGRPTVYALPASIPWLRLGETVYHEPRQPSEMPRAAAAIALGSLHEARKEDEVRRRNADLYLRRFAGRAAVPFSPPDSISGWLRFPLRIDNARSVTASSAALRAGVASSYPRILPELARTYATLTGMPASWPGAAELVERLLTLPTHSLLTERDIDAVEQLLPLDSSTLVSAPCKN